MPQASHSAIPEPEYLQLTQQEAASIGSLEQLAGVDLGLIVFILHRPPGDTGCRRRIVGRLLRDGRQPILMILTRAILSTMWNRDAYPRWGHHLKGPFTCSAPGSLYTGPPTIVLSRNT